MSFTTEMHTNREEMPTVWLLSLSFLKGNYEKVMVSTSASVQNSLVLQVFSFRSRCKYYYQASASFISYVSLQSQSGIAECSAFVQGTNQRMTYGLLFPDQSPNHIHFQRVCTHLWENVLDFKFVSHICQKKKNTFDVW